jgi:predicted SprT family Zn-dependent metalloprotease
MGKGKLIRFLNQTAEKELNNKYEMFCNCAHTYLNKNAYLMWKDNDNFKTCATCKSKITFK